MKINSINKYGLIISVVFNVFAYSMEQDKPDWTYYNDINKGLEEFDFDVDETKFGLNFEYKQIADDVNTPSRWKKEELERLPEIFTDIVNIRKRFTYEPPKVDNDQPITWLVIHGTFGHETPDYFDDKNLSGQHNFRHIKRAASAYATKKAKKLELLSFLWSNYKDSKVLGGCSNGDRVKGAKDTP